MVEKKWIDATGDVVTGDTIRFRESVFGGTYRKPTYLGDRTITALVTSDSYGFEKQQHTFSMTVITSDGEQPLAVGKKTRRKGRNVYRKRTERLVWENENERDSVADDKHFRGDHARACRAERLGL